MLSGTFAPQPALLLVSAFMCSHNSAEEDCGLFTAEAKGRRKKRRKADSNTGGSHLPSVFPLERLVATYRFLWTEHGEQAQVRVV